MQIVKIDYSYVDSKYGHSGSYSKVAINLEAAIAYINLLHPGAVDITEEHLAKNPWLDDEEKPLKVFKHVQERVDQDGDWDYPTETEIFMYFEDVIE